MYIIQICIFFVYKYRMYEYFAIELFIGIFTYADFNDRMENINLICNLW